MRKRVLVAVLHPLGGIRTYILYNYPTLVAAGYRFTFVAPSGAHFDALREELRCWEGTEFVAVPREHVKWRLASALRRLLRSRRYCLIHSHGFSSASMAVIANLGIGVPHAFTSHDVIRPHAQFPGITGTIKRFAFGHLLSSIERIVVVSNDAKENHFQWLPALRRRSSRVVTILHGIDTHRFAAVREHADGHLRPGSGFLKTCS